MKNEEISYNTKKALSEALKQAMKHKPFQKITVSELIQACHVNRKTFYYHFADIYALLKWTFEQEAIGVVRSFDLIVDYEEAITFIMDYIEENEYLINCAYDSIGRDELKHFFYADFWALVVSIIEQTERMTRTRLEPDYKEFLSQFYMEAIAGMMINWIKEREHRDRQVVIRYIADTIRYSLLGILRSKGNQTTGK
ncbi:TetR/AcrR family transcriptional regulator C-terminal domain-containing protein [Butyricicoccus sp.]|uniref:TetR/AcrR family transcriptional regulator C-terminal domain-containing protein n=1 Tax=Butyricicoccus sp. TaxID=2049021 RepID=UPI003F187812